MLAIICFLSGRRQTTVIGLTIRAAKHAHLVLFCVRVYSASSQLIWALSKRLCRSHVSESAVRLVTNMDEFRIRWIKDSKGANASMNLDLSINKTHA